MVEMARKDDVAINVNVNPPHFDPIPDRIRPNPDTLSFISPISLPWRLSSRELARKMLPNGIKYLIN
jgi:hypothetical protein